MARLGKEKKKKEGTFCTKYDNTPAKEKANHPGKRSVCAAYVKVLTEEWLSPGGID